MKRRRVTATLGERWFTQRGWQPFPFQREVWQAVEHGGSGLLHATTGAGKTYAVWLAALNRFVEPGQARRTCESKSGAKRLTPAPPLTVVWITPMRALAADTERALIEPLADMDVPWSVGVRSGDTSNAQRAKQTRRLPTALEA